MKESAIRKRDNDFEHLTDWRLPDGRVLRFALRIFCSNCTARGVIALPGGMAYTCQQSHAERAFRAKHWFVGRNRKTDSCPDCQAAERTRRAARRAALPATPVMPLPEKPIVMETPMGDLKSALAPLAVPKAEPPPVMTLEDRRLIFAKLHEVYLDPKTGYGKGWSDQKVADDMGVPRAWVAEMRKENFGEEKSSEEARAILAEAKRLHADAVRLHADMSTLAQQQTQARAELTKRADKVARDIDRLEEMHR